MAFYGHVDDLTGKRFHHLTVVGRGPPNHRTDCSRAQWVCLCDCGRLCIKDSKTVKQALHKTCGHSYCTYYRAFRERKPTMTEPRVSWELSMEDIEALKEETQHECYICGIPVSEGKGGFARKHRSGGYTRSNSMWCCWQCAKSMHESREEFHEWLERAKRTYKKHYSDEYCDE